MIMAMGGADTLTDTAFYSNAFYMSIETGHAQPRSRVRFPTKTFCL